MKEQRIKTIHFCRHESKPPYPVKNCERGKPKCNVRVMSHEKAIVPKLALMSNTTYKNQYKFIVTEVSKLKFYKSAATHVLPTK